MSRHIVREGRGGRKGLTKKGPAVPRVEARLRSKIVTATCHRVELFAYCALLKEELQRFLTAAERDPEAEIRRSGIGALTDARGPARDG